MLTCTVISFIYLFQMQFCTWHKLSLKQFCRQVPMKLPLSPFVKYFLAISAREKRVCTFLLVGLLRKNHNYIAQVKSLIQKALPSEQFLKLEGSEMPCPCCLGCRLSDPISSFLLMLFKSSLTPGWALSLATQANDNLAVFPVSSLWLLLFPLAQTPPD